VFVSARLPWLAVVIHSERDRLGFLRSMWMFGAAVDFKLSEKTPPQTILRQHSADGRLNQPFGLLLAHFPSCGGAYSARVAGMTMIQFSLWLGACKLHLGCVDDDHKITRILMGGEIWTMFAAQDDRRARRDTPKRMTLRIYKDPSPATQRIFA